MKKKDNLILLPKEEFEKVIFDVQGVKIAVDKKYSRVAIHNPMILNKRIPGDWTIDMFKRYLGGCVRFA